MILNHFQIVNYKNLKSTSFSFVEGINTIIGENDAGKSNAMTALRILLDDSYYYNTKRLKESDFSDDLFCWKGHWIILSAIFSNITSEDQTTEVCAGIIPENEDADFLKSYIKSGEEDIGVISLFIRPQKSIRKKLSTIKNIEEFNRERNKIRLSDYEFYYTCRAQTDFTNPEVYKNIVGDVEKGQYANPDDDDDSILGCKLNIADIQDHISVIFIDALRDVANELVKPKNPIRRIVESVESLIKAEEIEKIKSEIVTLNRSISEVEQIKLIGKRINDKLLDMIGMVYSPQIILESGLKEDINSLSRYLFMKTSRQNDIDALGLGHLNMIYMALKIVEYEVNRTRELINIMIIEEPEAHIHTHIQRTLFDKLKITRDYTQIIATTHSTHLAEVSKIKNINVVKSIGNTSIVMKPSNGLDDFGRNNLRLKNIVLSDCIERYLDTKRSVLLFSKGVILVEGDGEEILIPNMIREAFGVSLDEIGIGLINVGSVSFEYVASLFSEERIQRPCAIITDKDVQLVDKKSPLYKIKAEEKGKTRQEKLQRLYDGNIWVKSFYAPHTLEIDFALTSQRNNIQYIKRIIEQNYVKDNVIEKHKKNVELGSDEECATSILQIANNMGKGWYSTVLSSYLDEFISIPIYILEAVAFASKDVITLDIVYKIVKYSSQMYEDYEDKLIFSQKEKEDYIQHFIEEYKDDIAVTFINLIKRYCESRDE